MTIRIGRLGSIVLSTFVMAGTVGAADLRVATPPPPAFNWSGCYVGGFVGGASRSGRGQFCFNHEFPCIHTAKFRFNYRFNSSGRDYLASFVQLACGAPNRGSAFGSLRAVGLRLGGANVTGTRQPCRSGGLSSARARGGTLPRVALLAGVSFAALATLAPVAHAVDGIWTGGGAPVPNEWIQDNNWNLATVPDNTATFINNGAPTSVTVSDDASINTIQFTAGAPAFNFITSGTGITFDINGAGIGNNSAFAPSFTSNDNLNFNNASSAGNAVIINNNGGVVSFNNNSTAANATITTNSGGLTLFNDNSNGGNAQFIADAGGIVDFSNTAGPANDGNISA